MLPYILATTLILLPLLMAAASPAPSVLDVWPGLAPGEKTANLGTITVDHSDDVTRVTDVTKPQLHLYPCAGAGAHPAVLVCPGGGYSILAADKEGSDIAKWLNTLGYTAAVLYYRVPNNREGAIQDAQRAISLLRSRAQKFDIEPDHLGILGFSAGGHLAARTAASYGDRTYTPLGAIDRVSCRPDFALLIYPAYLMDKETGEPATEVTPHSGMPPFFLTQTKDDPYLDAPAYSAALTKVGIANECVIYPTGGHGYGLRLPADAPAHAWADAAAAWLAKHAPPSVTKTRSAP